MIRLLLAILLLLPSLAWGQSAGVGGPYFRDLCTSLTVHVTSKILCWEQSTATLKTWNGSTWVSVTAGIGDVIASGTLDLNFFALGAGTTTLKAVSLTGYVKGAGSSLPTASATIPTTDLTGALPAANFPALTGDITTSAGSLATSLSLTGVAGGVYGQVTVDTKGRVTAASTVADLAHGGTGVSSAADDAVLVSSGAAWVATVLTTCTGANKAVTYDAATNAFGCNTVTVGTGTVTNTGTLTANAFVIGNGGVDVKPVVITGLVLGAGSSVPAAYAGSTCADPSYVQSISAAGVATCNTPSGAGDVSHPAGALTSEFAIVGDGTGQIKARSVTGYYKGNAGSPLTAVSVIPVADGGTNLSSYTTGDLLYASGTATLARLAAALLGQMVISQGVGVAPLWSAAGFLSTSLRTPLVVGDTTAGGFLALRSTSGVGTTDSIRFQVGNSGATEAARITTAGNVGVGTTVPDAKLEVSGANKIALDVADSLLMISNPTAPNAYSGANYDRLRIGYESNVATIGTDAAGTGTLRSIRIATATNVGLNITVAGNVGVGTASPTSLLHVATGGGVQVGAPGGGNIANSVNVSGGFFVNGVSVIGAPSTAQYLVLAADVALSAERIATAGTGITLTDAGAGAAATFAVNQATAFAWTGRHSWTGTGVNATPLQTVTATVAGSRTSTGSLAIPAKTYGPSEQPDRQSSTLVTGSLSTDTDTTTYSTADVGNVGSNSALEGVSRVLGAAYTGLGLGRITQMVDNRVIANPPTVSLPTEQSTFMDMLIGVANQTVTGSPTFSGSPRVGTVGRYTLLSRTTTSNYVEGQRIVVSNFVNDQETRAIQIDAGDGIDVGTQFVGGDAIRVSTRNARNDVNAWTNIIKVWNQHTLSDVLLVRNDGSIFIDTPSAGVATVLDVRRAGGILAQVDNAVGSATDAPLLLTINGVLQRVHVGAPSSCGGQRCLVVDN